MGLTLYISLYKQLLLIIFVINIFLSCSNSKNKVPTDIIDGDLNIMFDANNFRLESYTNNVRQFELKTKRMTEYNDKRLVDKLVYNGYNKERGHEVYTIGHIDEDRLSGNVFFTDLRLIQKTRRLASKELNFEKTKGNFISPYVLILEEKMLMFGKKFKYNILDKEANFDDGVDAQLVENGDAKKLYARQMAKDEKEGLL